MDQANESKPESLLLQIESLTPEEDLSLSEKTSSYSADASRLSEHCVSS
jgi:hypothetical protein